MSNGGEGEGGGTGSAVEDAVEFVGEFGAVEGAAEHEAGDVTLHVEALFREYKYGSLNGKFQTRDYHAYRSCSALEGFKVSQGWGGEE